MTPRIDAPERRSAGWPGAGYSALAALLAFACGGQPRRPERAPVPSQAAFVGSERCAPCHRAEFDAWKGSHHALAMQVPSDASVLGDFDEATFEHTRVTSRFTRRDGRYFVRTDGPDGGLEDFAVRYVFGFSPLQQYLVELAGGRLQALGARAGPAAGRSGPPERARPIRPGATALTNRSGPAQ